MRHIKPGRGPSAMGVVAGLGTVVFGILWIVVASFIASHFPEPIRTVFPLFGVVFVLIAVAGVGYNLYNTFQKKRLSVLDFTTSREESDPLNDLIAGEQNSGNEEGSVESKLRELNALHRKGLVSDSEYATQRQRILNSL